MAIAWRSASLLSVGAVVLACAPQQPQAPPAATAPRFRVLERAIPTDSGPPILLVDHRVITIRGIDIQRTDGGLFGDLDSTEQGILRLTLFDSVPGKTLQEATAAPEWRQVSYEARFGPLVPGPYEIWVGRWDPGSHTVVVKTQPLHIEVQ